MAESYQDARKRGTGEEIRLIYYNYSPNQLEQKAEELLKKFDAERLIKTKPIDVYAVIEQCLDVPYDWKYLTPNQSYLGLTAFNDGYIWVWDKPYYKDGMLPHKLYLEKGTIVIDSTLTESNNRGRENFTVIHEVFHQVLHKTCFKHSKGYNAHVTTSAVIDNRFTAKNKLEYQANACAAAFLMPRELTTATFNKLYGHSNTLDTKILGSELLIEQLANEFSVSKQAMKYRLINLNLVK